MTEGQSVWGSSEGQKQGQEVVETGAKQDLKVSASQFAGC